MTNDLCEYSRCQRIQSYVKELKCMNIIAYYLNSIENADIYNKKYIAKNLFNFLIHNKWFLNTHTSFKSIVKSKLIELHKVHHWNYAEDIYEKIFEEQM